MMFNIIPLILILLSLGVIIIIVLRKFAVLANLDVDSIPAEREARVKEQIISSRLKRTFFKYYNQINRVFLPIGEWLGGLFKNLNKKLIEIKDNYKKEEEQSVGEGVVDKLLMDAEDLVKAENSDEAERKYIEIIGIDSTNIRAFKELGRLYYERKDYNESKQTILHALKLLEKDHDYSQGVEGDEVEKEGNKIKIAELYFDLTLVNIAMENYEEAFKSINKVLKLDGNNPRYLDTKLEISIINKDKISAIDVWQKLKEVNPENKKLEELKKQVDEL
jgi:tetratricopeptide (TPR) repeat protein